MLTFVVHDEDSAYIMDDTYTVQKTIKLVQDDVESRNGHEFITKDNGTRALHLVGHKWNASVEDSQTVGFEGQCYVNYNGFREYDTATWDIVYDWNAMDHIDLKESYLDGGEPEKFCTKFDDDAWDYLHLNAVDKFPDGDCLVSGRRTFALYKISHESGEIVWRLGGKNSSFTEDIAWIGQHGARVQSQNDTHTVVSFFDNGKFYHVVEPVWTNSRAIVLTLHTAETPMRATTTVSIDRPDLKFTGARGNFEVLQNGNMWAGWVKECLSSEHDAEGNLLMQAHVVPPLTTYRSFKAPWVGRPASVPDVAADVRRESEDMRMDVYVSWNGATEVDVWRLWESDVKGSLVRMLVEKKWQGFETKMTVEFAEYLVVEGLDVSGESLGVSHVVKLAAPADQQDILTSDEKMEDPSSPGQEDTSITSSGSEQPTPTEVVEEQTQDDIHTPEPESAQSQPTETKGQATSSSSSIETFVREWSDSFIATIFVVMVLAVLVLASRRLKWRPAWVPGSGGYKHVPAMEEREEYHISAQKLEAAGEFDLEEDSDDDGNSQRGDAVRRRSFSRVVS